MIIDEQREKLAGIGEWLERHGEAVYGTRAYEIFGYGDATIEDGHFGGQSATIEYSESDVRFTRSKDGKSVYIFTLGMPKANALREFHAIDGQVKNVSIVGSKSKLKWSQSGDKLSITTPAASEMNEIATVFKVEL